MIDWKTVILGDVCEIYQPQTISGADFVDNGAYPVYGANGIIGKYDKFNHAEPQLLITCRGATCGSVNVSQPNSWINGNAMVIRPRNNDIELKYLEHLFRGGLDLTAVITGAAQPQITRQSLSPLKIPLPPLPEQRRIAAILDQADALRAKRREALAQLDKLTQSIFIEMFGDLIDAHPYWKHQLISNFVAGFESGKSLAADDENDMTSNYRILKVSAVTSLEYKPHESKAAPADYTPQKSYFVKSDDLLFSRANTTELIGATAYVNFTPSNILLSDKIWRFIWHDEPKANPIFVNYLFRQPKFRAEIGRRASGTSGSMKNISQNKVLSISVALPPIELQVTFANRIKYVEVVKNACKTSLVELDNLFTSLQHRAFRGEL